MRRLARIVIGTAVLGFAASTSAAGQTATTPDAQGAVQQEPLVRELLRRLEAQERINAELLRRVAELEATRNGQLPAATIAPPVGEAVRQPSSVEDRLAAVEETAGRLEERIDAAPKITGSYDFEFQREGLPGTVNEFRQHRLFLTFSKEYRRFRVLGEQEFEYAPNFRAATDTSLSAARGVISLEQAWAEFVASDALTLRAGLQFFPNYWNEREFPSMVLSTRRPLMVQNVYPEALVGVMGYGVKYRGELGVGYHAYIGNSQGSQFGQHDTNSTKAVGGALTIDLPTRGLFDHLSVGANGYFDPAPVGESTRTWGAESQAERGPFELLFEAARRRAAQNRSGVYIQPSYRLTNRLTGFYRYDRLSQDPTGATIANNVGLNLRVQPAWLKFEVFRTTPPGTRGFNGIASSLTILF